jgi:hypothetical protein
MSTLSEIILKNNTYMKMFNYCVACSTIVLNDKNHLHLCGDHHDNINELTNAELYEDKFDVFCNSIPFRLRIHKNTGEYFIIITMMASSGKYYYILDNDTPFNNQYIVSADNCRLPTSDEINTYVHNYL